jgi:hypothetical protein
MSALENTSRSVPVNFAIPHCKIESRTLTRHGMEEVIGSIPIRSTNKSFRDINLRRRRFLGGSPEGAEGC